VWLVLLRKFGPYVVIGLAVFAVIAYVYHQGVSSERDRNAGEVLERTDEQRRDRETIEERNRRLDDEAATERLRPRPRE
jgi:hypothetical protein